MTTPQQLEEQVMREDIQPYLNSIYDGYLPESLIEQFRIAMMHIPPTAHKIPMQEIEKLSIMRPDEVTVKALGTILNVVFSIPFSAMYHDLEEGICKTMIFEKIMEDYNKSTAAFDRKCKAKMQRLLKLSGVGNSTHMNGNGMKIIPNS